MTAAGILWILLQASLKATVLLGSAAILALALRRGSGRLRHLVWSVALGAALLLPFAVAWTPQLPFAPTWRLGVLGLPDVLHLPDVLRLPDVVRLPDNAAGEQNLVIVSTAPSVLPNGRATRIPSAASSVPSTTTPTAGWTACSPPSTTSWKPLCGAATSAASGARSATSAARPVTCAGRSVTSVAS